MNAIELRGRITEAGQLEVKLPEGLPPGEVRVRIELAEGEDVPPFTDEEVDELMQITPMTGAEIVAAGLTGGWQDLAISDSTAWVKAVRRRRKERRAW
jgi:hypothetical protein